MHISNFNKLFDCYNQEQEKQVQIIQINKGEKRKLFTTDNKIVFLMQGHLRLIFNDFLSRKTMKGEILFLPAGRTYSYLALTDTRMIIFRPDTPIKLRENFRIEELLVNRENKDDYHSYTRSLIGVLDAKPQLWHLSEELNACITDGIKCDCYFDIKTKELLLILYIYYSKEDLYNFFYSILSQDTAFSEYIRLNWNKFHSVNEMAKSMNLTHKQFYKRFISMFGQTPQQWMKESRASSILKELIFTSKLIKQIANENSFNSEPQFTRFCKRQLGKTPTQIRKENITSKRRN